MNRTKILVQSTFFDTEDILRYHCSSYQELTVVDLDIFIFQLNIVQGLAQFSSFIQKLEKREKMMGNRDTMMYKYVIF